MSIIQVPEITDIAIYDPKKDGIDYSTFLKIKELNPAAAEHLRNALHGEALDTRLGYGTFGEFLDNPLGGYFSRTFGTARVVFVDGKLHSKYSLKHCNLERIAQETNAVPLCFDEAWCGRR